MTIYIQSCGVSQDNDYRWLKIRENNQIPEIPPILKRPFPRAAGITIRVTDLIDSQTPSIVLARSDRELLLLVTGLKAKEERTDFMGRKVRNSVAWVYPDSNDNERVIRSLAVRALRGELETEIDEAVKAGGEYGFDASYEAINHSTPLEPVGSSETEFSIKIGKNSLELREELALELQEHCLPQKDGLLVVVTGIKTKTALLQAGVWRGLSNRVEEEEWTVIPRQPVELAPVITGSRQNQSREKKTLLPIAIAVVMAVVIVMMIVFLAVKPLNPLTPEPKTNPSSSKVMPQMNLPTEELPQQ